MDYTQRHQAAQDAMRLSFDENKDEVLKTPNFSLMERFLVVGGKDPWVLYEKIMEIALSAYTKKSKNTVEKLKEELELRKHNCEWQEDFKGLFGLLKHNHLEVKNKNGNWFHRTEFNCGAIQFPNTMEELFAVTKTRHLHFFESLIQANIRKEAEHIPSAAFEFWTDKNIKKLFDEEINKFLCSDLSSNIKGMKPE